MQKTNKHLFIFSIPLAYKLASQNESPSQFRNICFWEALKSKQQKNDYANMILLRFMNAYQW